jgi:multidrug efflux pump subunit AcrA (membrane-fusion protein)
MGSFYPPLTRRIEQLHHRGRTLEQDMKRNLNVGTIGILGLLIAAAPSLVRADGEVRTPIRLKGCRIKPADQVTLSVNQSGVLRTVPREGDQVDAGQQVIQLEDDLARASLAAAEKEAANNVDIRYAEISSDVARLEHEQAIQVNERSKGAISITDVRRAKLEFDRSLLQIEQARHKQAIAVLKRDEAAAQLKMFHVVSPIVGTVNKVLKHKGEAVRQGEPILELVNTRRVRVEGFLDVADRGLVLPGTPVTVELEDRAADQAVAAAAGKIVFVDAVVQPVTQQVRIWADVDNRDERLLPGLTAAMTISSNPPPSNPSAREIPLRETIPPREASGR